MSLIIHKIYISSSVHPCDQNKGGCEQTCVKDGDNAKCTCREGYLVDGKSCGKELFIYSWLLNYIYTAFSTRLIRPTFLYVFSCYTFPRL